MINAQATKTVWLVDPAAETAKNVAVTINSSTQDAGMTANSEIDTLGFGYLQVEVRIGSTDAGLQTCKLQETDVSGSAYTDAAIFGTSLQPDADGGTASTLPGTTDSSHTFLFDLDLKGRKRYILPVFKVANTGTNGAFVVARATLSRPDITPEKHADRGVTQAVRV